MQTQISSGAHNDEEAFQSAEMNSAVDNDGLLPREFTTSDANDDDDGNNDEAEAAEPRYGYWSSNKNKCLAALIVVTAVVCIFAVGSGIKTAYDSKRSNAVGVATTYGNYGPVSATSATKAPTSKSSKAPKSKSSKAPKSKSSKAPKSKSSKAPTSAPVRAPVSRGRQM